MTTCSPSSPQTPTAEACAALAELTVRVFTPSAIASVRKILADNPRISLSQHLHLLGKLVVKHVAFSLDDPIDRDDDARRKRTSVNSARPRRSSKPSSKQPSQPASTSKFVDKVEHAALDDVTNAPTPHLPNEQRVNPDLLERPPVNLRLPGIEKRASYRDIAYKAVREKKILPAAVMLMDEEDEEKNDERIAQTASTKSTKRLSIRVSRGKAAGGEQLKKTRSGFMVNMDSTSRLDPFPRADMSSCLQSDSVARFKNDGGRDGQARGNRAVASSPMGMLAQFRKSRLEKRGKVR